MPTATRVPPPHTPTGTPIPTPTLVPPNDRIILEIFYAETNGRNWINNTNWLTDAPLGEWYGVTTNETGRVTVLFLASNELSGEIPSELGNLTNLETLSLWDNELRGEIPVELGVLANLKVLYLNNNELSGEIPSGLGNLTNLTTLALPNNELSGEIPSELGNLTN